MDTKRKIIFSIATLLIIGLIAFFGNRIHDEVRFAVSSVAGPSTSFYPNPLYTPGDVFKEVTKEEVCTPGYTKKVRSVPAKVRQQVYALYHVSYPQEEGRYEVDHFIPLELGGSNSIKNLWLEPAEPLPGFHQKDQVENYLHRQVCTDKESLEQAQKEMQTDWYAVYKRINQQE